MAPEAYRSAVESYLTAMELRQFQVAEEIADTLGIETTEDEQS